MEEEDHKDKVEAVLEERAESRRRARAEGGDPAVVLQAELSAIDKTVEESGRLGQENVVEGLTDKLKLETEVAFQALEKCEQLEALVKKLGQKREKTTAVALRPTKYLTGSTDIREYMARFMVYIRASGIKEDDWSVVDLLTSYLDSRAQKRVLRMNLDRNLITVEEALQYIVKELEEVCPKSKVRAQMYAITQKEGESIPDFATRVSEKAGIAYEDESMRMIAELDVFVTGVRDDDIGRDLLKAKHTDFEAAVEHATELESVYDSRKGGETDLVLSMQESYNSESEEET